jgi:HEPN domain-containing protein
MARYLGRKPITYDEETGKRCLEYGERIWRWVEETIQDP